MADIELVIKIPEYTYTHLCNGGNIGASLLIENAIKNGTPLPKGHGRLKDTDDIALIDEQFYVLSDYYVAESAINDSPTIIEADKEESEEI